MCKNCVLEMQAHHLLQQQTLQALVAVKPVSTTGCEHAIAVDYVLPLHLLDVAEHRQRVMHKAWSLSAT